MLLWISRTGSLKFGCGNRIWDPTVVQINWNPDRDGGPQRAWRAPFQIGQFRLADFPGERVPSNSPRSEFHRKCEPPIPGRPAGRGELTSSGWRLLNRGLSASGHKSSSHGNQPLACDLLKATRCAARFFFFFARRASARLSPTRSAETFCFGSVAVSMGVAVGAEVSVGGTVISSPLNWKLVTRARAITNSLQAIFLATFSTVFPQSQTCFSASRLVIP